MQSSHPNRFRNVRKAKILKIVRPYTLGLDLFRSQQQNKHAHPGPNSDLIKSPHLHFHRQFSSNRKLQPSNYDFCEVARNAQWINKVNESQQSYFYPKCVIVARRCFVHCITRASLVQSCSNKYVIIFVERNFQFTLTTFLICSANLLPTNFFY